MAGVEGQAVHRIIHGLVRNRKTLCAGGLVAMMGTRQKLKDGDEVDQVSAPNMYKYLKRRSSKIKRKMRRRRRREVFENVE